MAASGPNVQPRSYETDDDGQSLGSDSPYYKDSEEEEEEHGRKFKSYLFVCVSVAINHVFLW